MLDEIQLGEAARLLIENVKKNKMTKKKELRDILQSKKLSFSEDVSSLATYLALFGLRLVGSSTLAANESFFLVRSKEDSIKRKKMDGGTSDFKSTVVVLTLLYLEKELLELSRLTFLLCKIFPEDEAKQLIDRMKREKYITIEKNEHGLLVKYYWRFYLEFPEFNPNAYF